MCLLLVAYLDEQDSKSKDARQERCQFTSPLLLLFFCLFSFFGQKCRETKQNEAREQARTDGTTREKEMKQVQPWLRPMPSSLDLCTQKTISSMLRPGQFSGGPRMEIASWTTCTGHLLDYGRCSAQPKQQ